MRIVFLKDGETTGVGEHREGTERDLPDDVAAVLIKRGVAGVADALERGGEFGGINGSSSRGEQANGRE